MPHPFRSNLVTIPRQAIKDRAADLGLRRATLGRGLFRQVYDLAKTVFFVNPEIAYQYFNEVNFTFTYLPEFLLIRILIG